MSKEKILINKSKVTATLETQIEYIRYHNLVDTQELSQAILFDESKKLFSEKTRVEEKKRLLFLLAHNDSLEAYKLLQKYQENADKKLKAWTELCLQECGMYLGAELLDQDQTCKVVSGAGSDGQRLRFFLILSSEKSQSFTAEQKNLIKECAQTADEKLESRTEKISFGKDYILLSVMLPMEIALEEYFQSVYKSVNLRKKILRYHHYCTNVEKPTLKTIKEYLEGIK
jgi:hypothetical protein